ncbi:MAG: bifunctional DNA-binding transcriptional regulator/O6-methylguanine-DNA methyltransferase Ada [Alphaproteobacteria bacterium]
MTNQKDQLNDTARWRAVLGRETEMDGRFVYGVETTGIYCRPSCPSRRPRRENVRFFADGRAAVQAGFRACKRCGPDGHARLDPAKNLARRACAFIDERVEGPPTLAALAAHLKLSPYHVQRTFSRVMGISPRAYADARRLGRFKHRLKRGAGIADALYDAGYGSSSRIYEHAGAQLGMTPAAYRKGGRDMRIAYTVVRTPLGPMIVAGTNLGVSYIAFDDDEGALEAALRAEYPEAEVARDDSGMGRYVKPIADHVAGHPSSLELPLDVQATAFQRRVWQALRDIPIGETRTYRQIARAVGAPKAARAVGNACARNPVSIVVPCHRAIRGDGSLGGYAWGLARKRRLLDIEKELATEPPKRRRAG